MAEKDMTGRAADSAAHILLGALNRVKRAVPMGPSMVQMTPSELRARIEKAGPGSLQRLLQQLGPEQAMKLLLNSKDSVGAASPAEYFDGGML